MNQKTTRKIAALIAIVLVTAMVVTSFSFVLFMGQGSGYAYGAQTVTSQEETYIGEELDFLKNLIPVLKVYYKDDISIEDLVNGAYQGVFDALDDPYSVYYVSQEERDAFVDSVNGEYNGVGVSLEIADGKCRVVSPILDTPADRAGIKSGDIVTKVDGASVEGLPLGEISAKLRGDAGTTVTVTVLRDGAELTFPLVRESIKSASVDYELLDGKIGYIRITQFDNDTDVEFTNAKLKLLAEGAESFLVDVRNNPGGYVETAVKTAEQLMPAGPISFFQQQGKIVETFTANGWGDLKKPVVLLVNGGTASAAEILAGAWQDSGVAKVVGTTTYGKGVAQQIFDLKNGHTMKLSSFYFLTPDQHVINHVGITPDYVVENRTDVDSEDLMKQYLAFAPMSEGVKPKAGDTGLNVFGAQQRLALLGHEVNPSGTMDAATVAAVKRFQGAEGLSPYGVLDFTTMRALDREALAFAQGSTEEDLQMQKAVELLSEQTK